MMIRIKCRQCGPHVLSWLKPQSSYVLNHIKIYADVSLKPILTFSRLVWSFLGLYWKMWPIPKSLNTHENAIHVYTLCVDVGMLVIYTLNVFWKLSFGSCGHPRSCCAIWVRHWTVPSINLICWPSMGTCAEKAHCHVHPELSLPSHVWGVTGSCFSWSQKCHPKKTFLVSTLTKPELLWIIMNSQELSLWSLMFLSSFG